MVPSPTSKRRREQGNDVGQQQQHASQPSSRTEPQQLTQAQDHSMSSSHPLINHLDHNYTKHNETPSRTVTSSVTTKKPPHRKTVVVVDAPRKNDPVRRMSPEVTNLHNNSSFHSFSSIQSSVTYASAQQEFMVDCETDFSNNLDADEENMNLNHIVFNATPMISIMPNDASNSTGVTALKSSEASSSNSSSMDKSGHRTNNGGTKNGNATMNHKSTNNTNHLIEATTIPGVTWQGNSEFPEDSDDDTRGEKLTGWKLFVETISNVPNDEYYTKPCTSSYEMLQKSRITLGYAISNHVVQTIIVILIIINALLMGVATFDFVTEDPKTQHIFSILDLTFLIIFTIELGLQLFYRGLSLLYDAWLVFDLIIIVLSWSLQSIQIIRAFRIFRALRLVARLQVLRELIGALGAVMPRMYAISMLLLLIFYIFAVLFTQLFGDLELSGNYFSTLDASLFTCMNMMTLEWINVTREVMTHLSWAWAPISSFISITGFIVYNLIVAVVCDAVAVLDRKKQQEAKAAQKEIDAVTQRDQIHVTQQRFEELSNGIERMKQQHMNLCHTVDMLTSELQQSMIVIANLQQQLSQSQNVKKMR